MTSLNCKYNTVMLPTFYIAEHMDEKRRIKKIGKKYILKFIIEFLLKFRDSKNSNPSNNSFP